jgi:glucokinase
MRDIDMTSKDDITAIGVDLGGTKILAGKVCNGKMYDSFRTNVPKAGTEQEVINALYIVIDEIFDETVSGIGIGVPSVVDIDKGIVFDVQNIPSWKEVNLKDILESKYEVPVYLNNDANCFAIGEKYFGKGRNYDNFAAVINGTGLAAGLIIHNKLYNGTHCGAGEFGMIPYLDHHLEFYCSGQFFNNVHNINGETVFQRATEGDEKALIIFEEYGRHLGNAINIILYAIDPEIIIMGGSVTKAYRFFKKTLWEGIEKMVFGSVTEQLTIELSSNPDIAVLGAAALYYDTVSAKNNNKPKIEGS